jgi:hypothetical protein
MGRVGIQGAATRHRGACGERGSCSYAQYSYAKHAGQYEPRCSFHVGCMGCTGCMQSFAWCSPLYGHVCNITRNGRAKVWICRRIAVPGSGCIPGTGTCVWHHVRDRADGTGPPWRSCTGRRVTARKLITRGFKRGWRRFQARLGPASLRCHPHQYSTACAAV